MPHWSALKAAISARNLDQFIAPDGKEAARRLVHNGFDPLMGAHNLILGRCLDRYGLVMMTPNPDGSDRCPLCSIEHDPVKCHEPDCTWIQGAADDALREAIRLGLVGSDRRSDLDGQRREGQPEGEWIEKGIEHAAETGHAHAPATIEGDAGTASEEDETP